MPPEELCWMLGKPMEIGTAVAGTGKQKKGKKSKGKAAKRATGEDTVRVDDSDVESELEKLVRLDDEEEEEGPPEAAQCAFARTAELWNRPRDIPDVESSADAIRRGPTSYSKDR
jgi:hypothetical protein